MCLRKRLKEGISQLHFSHIALYIHRGAKKNSRSSMTAHRSAAANVSVPKSFTLTSDGTRRDGSSEASSFWRRSSKKELLVKFREEGWYFSWRRQCFLGRDVSFLIFNFGFRSTLVGVYHAEYLGRGHGWRRKKERRWRMSVCEHT